MAPGGTIHLCAPLALSLRTEDGRDGYISHGPGAKQSCQSHREVGGYSVGRERPGLVLVCLRQVGDGANCLISSEV